MKSIFDEITLNNITVKNRIARSATHSYLGNLNGTLSRADLDIYEQVAENNNGLIFTGHCYVSEPLGKVTADQLALYDDIFIDKFKPMIDSAHKHNCKIVAQISHAGAQSQYKHKNGEMLAAPSDIEHSAGNPACALTVPEIDRIRDDFVDAAYRAKQAGFDGIQVHCAHNYLLCEFISPVFNFRNDMYGGSVENRFRLPREIIEGIRLKCGVNFPIFVKLNSNIERNDDSYERDLLYIIQQLEELRIEAVELSGCDFIAKKNSSSMFYLERAARMKAQTNIPIILVGGIRSLEDMQRVLDSGIDMISLCRTLICEPDLISRLISGQPKAKCINCSKCFSLPREKGIRCILHDK